jgi:phosphopantothenoylcysteine decarboxylase/phosphopantothenate--cysteine ligase
MNTNMLAHPAVQQNLQRLAERGVRFVEPGEGYLACGWIGKGRLAEPDVIVQAAVDTLAPRDSLLHDRRVLVTAGPTYEDIDPVRYVGNRSSGRMGFAIAEAAQRRGAHVTLVAGPTSLEPPIVDALIRVRSAAEMHRAVMQEAMGADVVVMAAAVADYAPAKTAAGKITKGDGPLTLTLDRTPDILAELGRLPSRRADGVPLLVGFAAETGNAIAKARAKRARKQIDLMVSNDVAEPGVGFDVATNAVTLITEDDEQVVPLQQKADVAARILDRVETLLRARTATTART